MLSGDCSEMIDVTAAGGVLTSPNYPDVYGNVLDCQWILQAEEGYRVSLTVTDFQVETCRGGCGCDVVEASDCILLNINMQWRNLSRIWEGNSC